MKKIYVSKRWLCRVVVFIIIMSIGVMFYAYDEKDEDELIWMEDEEALSAGESKAEAEDEEISAPSLVLGVHVTGAVVYPDQVVYLQEGSRVEDALEAVGGALEEADLAQLNLAGYVSDGQRIRVPFVGEITDNPIIENNPSENSEKHLTNINLATKIELLSLPGIGESYAERIIAYREENGPFTSIEEIKNVKGIGEGKFAELKDKITVG